MKEYISELILENLEKLGFEGPTAIYLKLLILLIGFLIISALLFSIGGFIVNRIIARITAATKTDWDDILLRRKVFRNLPHLLPAIAFIFLSDFIFADFPGFAPYIRKLIDAFIVLIIISVFYSFMNAVRDIMSRSEAFKDKPVNSYIQLIKIIAGIIAGVMIISVLLGTSPLAVFTTMGALTAIIILIFRDTILGFVASIQMASNDMVRIGDWVTLDDFGADGDVIDITLNTVKVRNFDKTISTVPTYAFISHSFKNWRGMSDSDGRRIKRSVLIKISSIKFLSPDEIEELKKINLLKDYLEQRSKEVEEYNKANEIDDSSPLNGRRLTNVGTFRAYLEAYLAHHPKINQNMTCMVRQLSPGSEGLPLELYTFSADKNWVNYEKIMADIFDHVFASSGTFGLEFFEKPSGADFQNMLSQKS